MEGQARASNPADQWTANIFDYGGDNYMSVVVTPAANALVGGRYKVFAESVRRCPGNEDLLYRHKVQDLMTVLFNPWSKGGIHVGLYCQCQRKYLHFFMYIHARTCARYS